VATRHGTLAANTAAPVSLADRDVKEIGVLHKANSTEPIYARCDGGVASVSGDDTFVVLAGQRRWVPRVWSAGKPSTISLISEGAIAYEVEFP
jgi:hypothetical protein